MLTPVIRSVPGVLGRSSSTLLIWLMAFLVAGCSVMFISPYDSTAVARTEQISKAVLGFYQVLLDTAPAQRKTAFASALGKSQSDVETQMRLHLLREQARAKNEDSIRIATNMLDSWRTFSASHLHGDATALSNETLNIERGIMERHLGSAFKAEEAKKLGG